jgi:hypothetical protein
MSSWLALCAHRLAMRCDGVHGAIYFGAFQPIFRIESQGRDMEQVRLIVDSLNDAVRDTARVIGLKEIAKELWPAKGTEAAARYLNDCLNPERDQKLSGEEILHIARRGRELGCHMITAFFNMDAGYAPPIPVDPEDQKAELQREFIATGKRMEAIYAHIQRTGAR